MNRPQPPSLHAGDGADIGVAEAIEVGTEFGPARVHRFRAAGGAGSPARLLMLGHGAGGGVDAADLLLATQLGLRHGFDVALVEQPYRVAGRRAPAPARQVDAAWITVAAHLTGASATADAPGTGSSPTELDPASGVLLVTGGRSFGARVACRTAVATGAIAVLCLAFPTHPPKRPEASRQSELDAVAVPVLVVQGERDPFGVPAGSATTRVVTVAGDHSLTKDHDRIRAHLDAWLSAVTSGSAAPP